MKFLLICSCSGQSRKAEIAYDIIYPDAPIPQMVKGKEAIAKLATKYKNDHLKAISKLSGNYSYYIDITDSGKIIEEYDLTTGKRVA